MSGSTEISMLVGMDSANALKALEGIYDGIADIAKIAKQDMDIRLEATKGLEGLKNAKKMIQDLQLEAKKKLELLLSTDVAERDMREIQKQLAEVQKLSGMEVEIDFEIDNQPLEELTGIPKMISGAFSGLGGIIQNFLNPLNLIPNIFSAITGAAGLLQSAFSGMVSVISGIGSLVSSAIMLPFQAVSAIFNTITSVVSSVVGGFMELVHFVGNLGQAFDTLVRFAQPVINFFTGIYDSLSNAVNVTADFEKQISNVASVTGASATDMKLLSDAALQVGADTALSSSQAAEALYSLGSAGLSTADAIAALNGVAKLSEATQSDLASSTETVVSTISQFGLTAADATKIANVFAAGAAASQLTMDRLAGSLKNTGAVAGTVGMSLEQTVAILGVLSNAGYMGEQAGTALKGAISSLINPVGTAGKALEELGISAEEIGAKFKAGDPTTFISVLQQLEAKGADARQMMMLFGEQAGPAMMSLLSKGSAAILKMQQDITGTNAAFDAAKIQLDNYRGAAQQLSGSIETVQILIGGIFQKSLTMLTNALIDVVNGFTAFLQVTGLITTATSILTGITQVFLGALNLLQPVITVIVGAFTTLGTILATVGDTFVKFVSSNEAFKNSFSAVGNVITVLATTLQGFIANITGLSPSVLKLGADLTSLKTAVTEYVNQLLSGKSAQEAFKTILNSILLVIKTLATSLVTITTAVLQFINSFQFQNLATGEGILNAIALAVENLSRYISESITKLTLWVSEFISSGTAFNTLKTILSTGIVVFKGVVNTMLLIPAAITNILPAVSSLASGLSNAFVKLTEGNIKGAIEETFNTISTVIANFIGAIAGNREALTTTFKQIFDDIANGFADIKKNIIEPMIADFKLALQNGLLTSISEIAAKVADSIKVFGTTLSTGLSQVFRGMKSIGQLLKETLAQDTGETSKLFSPITEAIKQGIEIVKVTINEGIPAISSLAIPLIKDVIKAMQEAINMLPVSDELKKGLVQITQVINTGLDTGKLVEAFRKIIPPIIKVINELTGEIKKTLSDGLRESITGALDISLAAIIAGIGIWAASISTTITTAVTSMFTWLGSTGAALFLKSIASWFISTTVALPVLIASFSVVVGQYLIQQGFVWAGYLTTALLTAGLAIAAGIAAWPAIALAAMAGLGLAIYNYLIGHSLIDDIPMWFGEVFNATAEYFKTVGAMLSAPFMEIWSFINETITVIAEYATQIGETLINTIVSLFDSGATLISTSFNAIWNFMSESIDTVIGFAKEIADGLINTINDIIIGGKDIIVSTLTTIWDSIKGMIDIVVEIGGNIGKGLMDAISGAIEAGVDAINAVLDGIVSAAQATYDKIMAIVNLAKSAASGISNLATSGTLAGGTTIQLGEAMMATGGIIKAQQGGTLVRAAEAGKNEAYVPLPDGNSIPVSFSNLPDFSALSGNANNNVNISFGDVNINNDIDEREFFKRVESTVSNALIRRNGRR